MNGFTTTPRNAMQMVGSLTERTVPTFLHFDGQFNDPVDLVKSTITGRNFGWGPTQFAEAEAHIAKVIREDNGVNVPAQEYGENLSYAMIFLGAQPGIPKDVLLPAQYRLDVTKATDDQIVTDIAQLIAQYTYGLLFKQDQYRALLLVSLRCLPADQSFAGAAEGGRNDSAVRPAPGESREWAKQSGVGDAVIWSV